MTEQYDDRPERAFRDALFERAGDFEPAALDLAAPGRRTPWRTWGAAAAAAVLVAGTVGGVAWWQGDDRREGVPSNQSVDGQLPAPDPGWRYESYRDVVLQVPESWGYSAAPKSDWCAILEDGPASYPTEPFVDTLGGAHYFSLAILCNPNRDQVPLGMEAPERLWATHLSFGDPNDSRVRDGEATYDGWTRIVTTIGHARFTVLADHEHLADAQRIVDSAQVVTADHHGCDATSPIQDGLFPRPPHAFDLSSIGSVDGIAVCQYDVTGRSGEPGLIASRLLSVSDANAELGALQGTTIGSGPNDPDSCLPAETRDTAVVLRLDPLGEPNDVYVFYDSCVHNGFDDGTNVRQLTQQNCVPLWGERVAVMSGSSVSVSRCHNPG